MSQNTEKKSTTPEWPDQAAPEAAEPRPREPFVKFGKPGLLVERVSELVETPRVQIACGGAKALH